MTRRFIRLTCACLALLGPILPLTNSAAAAGHPLELPTALQAALASLRNGHYQQSLEASRGLRESFPSHPLPSLIAAESNWGLIFCQTGHINSREIWNSAEENSSSFDDEFFRAAQEALAAAEALRETPATAPLGAFYEGLVHGVRARLYTLRAETLNSGRAGKQMRESLLEAVTLNSDLQADADAGLGTYNYYADVLSPLVKFLRLFLFLPGGDRDRGLEQLESASQHAVLVAPEARFELAKIYGLRENRPTEALLLFRGLTGQYPGNAIFALSAAIQAERTGEKSLAIDYARKAMQASRQMDDVCRARLDAASQQALERLTGGGDSL